MKMIINELFEWMDAIAAVIPGRAGRGLRALYWRRRLASLGRRPSLGMGLRVLGAKNVKIGVVASINTGCFLSAEEGRIVIGDHVGLNNNVHINASLGGEILIGKNVMIGPNCVLRASDHVIDDPAVPMQHQGHTGGAIILEDDVWLGANVVVVAGVRIGRGSVVAAGAVVTRDVEAWSVVGGVPARLIKKRAADLLETI